MTAPELEKHLKDITAEQARRRDPAANAIPDEDRNEYLAAMSNGALQVDTDYIRQELFRHDADTRRSRAYFN
ncbi:hypothetical protein [Kocuria dechangensis]|nr:hypothetical protein [Kocuria dechangensis]